MAANPNPNRITAGMWWFIEEWERMEPATVYAGSWGNFKPGYHCDWNTIHANGWAANDYSVKLAEDQVGGTYLAKFGCAVDITFPDAQSGDYTRIRKYSDRVKSAWAAFDPRLIGWREVLCNCSDNDSAADGFDIPGHYERTPDDTHKWHKHYSILRKHVDEMERYQAMMSVLRGESLSQWLTGGGGDSDMRLFMWNGGYWLSRGDGTMGRETPPQPDAGGKYSKMVAVYGSCVVPGKDGNGWPSPDLKTQGWTEDDINKAFGMPIPWGSGAGPHDSSGGGGVTMEQVNAAISGSTIKPPGTK